LAIDTQRAYLYRMDRHPRTELRIFQGLDGFAGFRLAQPYELHLTDWEDSHVLVKLPHAPNAAPLIMERARFEAWWGKPT